ncbi:MAG: hypothetical protein AMDU3_IPLC00003G0024 [Thermoplasmatales archaeon I-plasma]|nr:MAG: hypothetical protein AMDU3_IPLC00003G0024 [Thermoplasmatales archaeon I-plasma]
MRVLKIEDMPKLESPFVRKMINGKFLVTSEVAPGYEWVFADPATIATEKLDGTDVSIVIEDGTVTSIWNRTYRIPFINKERRFIIDAVLESYDRGYCMLPDGQWFGEVIGKDVQGNPYGIDYTMWLPFNTYVRDKLSYNSWGKYPKTYESIRSWFQDGPISLFMLQHGIKDKLAEGIVFHNPRTEQMAKLRRDMFDFYAGSRHKEETKK